MSQQRKQMTQAIFSTGFSLSFFFLSQTTSSQGKLPSPIANTHRRLRCGPEPHGARQSRTMAPIPTRLQPAAQRLASRLPSRLSYQHGCSSSTVTATTLHPTLLGPNTFQPEVSRRFTKRQNSQRPSAKSTPSSFHRERK